MSVRRKMDWGLMTFNECYVSEVTKHCHYGRESWQNCLRERIYSQTDQASFDFVSLKVHRFVAFSITLYERLIKR